MNHIPGLRYNVELAEVHLAWCLVYRHAGVSEARAELTAARNALDEAIIAEKLMERDREILYRLSEL